MFINPSSRECSCRSRDVPRSPARRLTRELEIGEGEAMTLAVATSLLSVGALALASDGYIAVPNARGSPLDRYGHGETSAQSELHKRPSSSLHQRAPAASRPSRAGRPWGRRARPPSPLAPPGPALGPGGVLQTRHGARKRDAAALGRPVCRFAGRLRLAGAVP